MTDSKPVIDFIFRITCDDADNIYKYKKPEPSAKIKSEIVSLESTIQELLKKVLG